MFKAKVRSKFLDISRSPKLLYIVGIGVLLAIGSYFLYQNFLVVVTILSCIVALLSVLSKKPKEIEILLNEEELELDGDKVAWEKCVAWAVVDLGDDLEFVVQTSSFTRDFFYFYIQETTQEAKDLMRFFTEFLPYDETIPKRNLIHSILRSYGLK